MKKELGIEDFYVVLLVCFIAVMSIISANDREEIFERAQEDRKEIIKQIEDLEKLYGAENKNTE